MVAKQKDKTCSMAEKPGRAVFTVHYRTACHHGYAFSVICPCKALNAAHIIDQLRIFEICLRDKPGPQRVTRHQYCFCERIGRCVDMGGWYF